MWLVYLLQLILKRLLKFCFFILCLFAEKLKKKKILFVSSFYVSSFSICFFSVVANTTVLHMLKLLDWLKVAPFGSKWRRFKQSWVRYWIYGYSSINPLTHKSIKPKKFEQIARFFFFFFANFFFLLANLGFF